MLQTTRAYGGMVTAPHHLAAQAGLGVLREGGNAIEAMLAAAASIAAVYPHMNSLGGDNFWLIQAPGEAPFGIDACGPAAAQASLEFYRDRGHSVLPSRGPLAALTVAGAVSGWQAAWQASQARFGGRMPLDRIFADAIGQARDGIAVTRSQSATTRAKQAELEGVPGFATTFLPEGRVPEAGERLRLSGLAATLERLAEAGLEDFYRGDLARAIATDLAAAGSPVTLADLEAFRALPVAPLGVAVGGHRVFNLPPPTQGLASLMLLAIYDRLGITEPEGFGFVHGLVESTKRAFRIRDAEVSDPAFMRSDAASFLDPGLLDALAREIDPAQALPWPDANVGGDTVWLGAIDKNGLSVSFIQSLYWEYGSGLVLPQSGITWQNRGISFSLDPAHHNALQPGRRPFHTIQPALAQLSDGRTMVFGTMGGEGQPQTQAMVFSRYALYGGDLQESVTAPRWLLGRTWGDQSANLKLEDRFDPDLVAALRAAGHDVAMLQPFDELAGHAGALVHHPDGLIEGASDPRSDGAAVGF